MIVIFLFILELFDVYIIFLRAHRSGTVFFEKGANVNAKDESWVTINSKNYGVCSFIIRSFFLILLFGYIYNKDFYYYWIGILLIFTIFWSYKSIINLFVS